MYPYLRLSVAGHELALSTYNIMVAAGVILAVILLDRMLAAHVEDRSRRDRHYFATIIAFFAGMVANVGLTMLLFRSCEFRGFTFYMGLAAALPTAALLYRLLSVPVVRGGNLAAPSVVLAHALGRVGCFLAGCCHGLPTSCPTGVVFASGSPAAKRFGQHTAVHPTQLYEAVFLAALFPLVLRAPLKYRMAAYLGAYAIFRFVIEFLRGDPRGRLVGTALTPSQFLALGFLAVAGVCIYWVRRPGYESSG